MFRGTLHRVLDCNRDGVHEEVYRCVDDSRTFTREHGVHDSGRGVSEVFYKNGCALFFVPHVPVKEQIQFVDLCLLGVFASHTHTVVAVYLRAL